MKLDTRDKIVLALIIIAIIVVAWAGYNAFMCSSVRKLYEPDGGIESVCYSCENPLNIVWSGDNDDEA